MLFVLALLNVLVAVCLYHDVKENVLSRVFFINHILLAIFCVVVGIGVEQ